MASHVKGGDGTPQGFGIFNQLIVGGLPLSCLQHRNSSSNLASEAAVRSDMGRCSLKNAMTILPASMQVSQLVISTPPRSAPSHDEQAAGDWLQEHRGEERRDDRDGQLEDGGAPGRERRQHGIPQGVPDT